MALDNRASQLQQFTVSDFVEWFKSKRLVLNPEFQRRSVWKSDARSYLIDTILNGFPIPKVFLRTKIDTVSKSAVRDVVDGQQRLRAILDFADDKLTINKRSPDFEGLKYSDLSEDQKAAFLSYPISVDHLVNANDDKVLQVFARLNTYTVPLNAAEKRHAEYQTPLRWSVYNLSQLHRRFLIDFGIFSTARLLRMADDEFFAGLIYILKEGVSDGGSAPLTKLYKEWSGDEEELSDFNTTVGDAINWMTNSVPDALRGTALSRSYQIEILFAAYAYHTRGLPQGRLASLPPRRPLVNNELIVNRLRDLALSTEAPDGSSNESAFAKASSAATNRMNSRSIRFLAFSDCLTAEP